MTGRVVHNNVTNNRTTGQANCASGWRPHSRILNSSSYSTRRSGTLHVNVRVALFNSAVYLVALRRGDDSQGSIDFPLWAKYSPIYSFRTSKFVAINTAGGVSPRLLQCGYSLLVAVSINAHGYCLFTSLSRPV